VSGTIVRAWDVDPVRVLVDLVSTPSVSGQEQAAVDVFARHANEMGMRVETDEAGNVIASRGLRSAAVHIVLLGHIDTVPGHIPVRMEDGVLHGRGSVDAKGPLAAMLLGAAAAELPDDVQVSVIGAVGEETPRSPGARFLVDRLQPAACIIGEPSGWDGVTLGYKGRLLVEATSTKSNAHSAGPDLSPGDELWRWWAGVRALTERLNIDRSRAFDQLQATIQSMGSSADGLIRTARLQAGFRLPPRISPEVLAAELRSLAPDDMRIEITGAEHAFASDRNDLVARAISNAIRAAGGIPRPKLKTGTSDMNIVAPRWRCPIAAYGPGDSALDHTPEERISLEEFDRSIEVLRIAIATLAAEVRGRPRWHEENLSLASVAESPPSQRKTPPDVIRIP
jgi:LysW-gamma-L-lysine carboxypeptidase